MQPTNLNRRAFLRGKRPSIDSNAIRPPWTIKASRFVEACERCDKCIEQCPEKILFRGDGGFPEIDFNRGQCTFCAVCVDVCQSKAYRYFKTNEPHDICADPKLPWNLTVTIKKSCLSLNAIVCRTCGDNCDEQAIQFSLQLGGVSIPKIDNDKCTGCGQCLYICPENAISIKNTN